VCKRPQSAAYHPAWMRLQALVRSVGGDIIEVHAKSKTALLGRKLGSKLSSISTLHHVRAANLPSRTNTRADIVIDCVDRVKMGARASLADVREEEAPRLVGE
jgi:hypothetical protein